MASNALLEQEFIGNREMVLVRQASRLEIQEAICKFKKEHMHLRFQQSAGTLKDPSRFKKCKRSIQRLSSELTNKKAGRSSRSRSDRYYNDEGKNASRIAALYPNDTNHFNVENQENHKTVVDLLGDLLEDLYEMIASNQVYASISEILNRKISLESLDFSELSAGKISRSTHYTADQVTALLLPFMHAQPKYELTAALKGLALTTMFDAFRKESSTATERVAKLLADHNVPATLSADLLRNDGEYTLSLEGLFEISLPFEDTPVFPIPSASDSIMVTVFAGASGSPLTKLDETRVSRSQNPWKSSYTFDVSDEVFVAVNGRATLVQPRAFDKD